MYFSLIPDIKYDVKPVSYPFSESDYVTAKNFFRRYQVNSDIFDYAVFYSKYAVEDGERLEQIAQKAYGQPYYDWIIALTNNMINPLFGLPLNSDAHQQLVEEKYGDETYSGIHHYETLEVLTGQTIDGIKVKALDAGVIVDENFYNTPFTYWNGSSYSTVAGSNVSIPISNYEYEVSQNEKKREIFILKNDFFDRFVEEFKTKNLYTESSDFISKRLKKVAV